MPVPLENLGGNGRGFQSQALADPGLHLRAQVGEGAHRAGNFAHRVVFRAATRRIRCRIKSAYHRANFRPRVMGPA